LCSFCHKILKLTKGSSFTNKLYNLYTIHLGVVLVRSAPTTFHIVDVDDFTSIHPLYLYKVSSVVVGEVCVAIMDSLLPGHATTRNSAQKSLGGCQNADFRALFQGHWAL
jgi:hypothetical protein